MRRAFWALAWWGIILTAVPVLAAVASATQTPQPQPADQAPTLVFVSKSDACECERNLCIAGEQEVINFLASNPWGFVLERVDLAESPAAAKELGILAVPVVFLRDGEGRQISRFDGFFSWQDLEQAWRAHLAEGSK